MKRGTRPDARTARHSGAMLPYPIGVDYVVIVGVQEVARDMRTGEQEIVGLEAAVAWIVE
jgi:hypothetical protein